MAHNFLWGEAPRSSLGLDQAPVGPGETVLQPKPALKRDADKQMSASESSKVLGISRKIQNRWSGNLPSAPPACPPRTHTYKHTHVHTPLLLPHHPLQREARVDSAHFCWSSEWLTAQSQPSFQYRKEEDFADWFLP